MGILLNGTFGEPLVKPNRRICFSIDVLCIDSHLGFLVDLN